MKYSISDISRMLADKADDVCRWLLPGGRKQGHEWCVGNVDGTPGDSLRVNLGGKAGVWRDFASDEKGGDLIDLIMAAKGISKREAVQEAKDYLGLRDDSPEFTPKRQSYKLPEKPHCTKPKKQAEDFFNSRGISQKTLDVYKIGDNGKEAVFPCFHGETLKLIKYRSLSEKKFRASADSEPVLFGWQALLPNQRSVIITEGEIDALSFAEQGTPALSLPFGAGTGGNQDNWIAAEWENLLLFDVIFLALDMDEPGQKAAEYIANRLGNHRCRVVDFGKYKDANEAHLAGENLGAMLGNSEPCDPPELRSASAYVDEVIDYFHGKTQQHGYKLPWSKTYEKVGLRKAEISVWAGINGHGKSQVVGHVLVDSIRQNERWCVASMEFKPFKLLARMYRQTSGLSQPSADLCRGTIAKYFSDQLFLFDVQGTAKAERILEVFEYAYRRYGCTSFLVDSLAKCGFGEDDYNGQKAFVDKLMEFAQQFNVHVHLVCHMRKGRTENDEPDKMDIKGTGAITDMVDNVFTVWRNKPKEKALAEKKQVKPQIADAPDCFVECCKQRNGEWEGKIPLWFEPASLQYTEGQNYKPWVYAKAQEPQVEYA